MMNISKAKITDKDLIHEFFRIVIQNTFKRNGLSELVEDINKEISDKKGCLDQYFESAEERCFLIAKDSENIIGSVAYAPASDLINACTNGELKDLLEINTLFVHPDHQQKGIGNQLLHRIVLALETKGIQEFCLDSGYESSQTIWLKKFGPPQYHLKDYWGKHADHMIWRVSMKTYLNENK